MEVSLRCHNSPRRNRARVTSLTGSARRFVWEFEESQSRVLDAKRRGSTFGARRREANLRPMVDRSRWGPNELVSIEDCVSPPYVETFNSMSIKRFRTWTRSRYVFSNSEIPMFYRYEHYMSISHIVLIVNMVQKEQEFLLIPCPFKSHWENKRRMIYASFNRHPCTIIVPCYNPTNASDETDIITFYNELSSLGCSIPKHTCPSRIPSCIAWSR